MALASALVSALTAANPVVPALAAPAGHPILPRSETQRHRPWWMKLLDQVTTGVSPSYACPDDLAGGPRPTETIYRGEGWAPCFGGGFAQGDQPVLHIHTLDGGTSSILGEGDSNDDDPRNNNFSWNLGGANVDEVMTRPGSYRYEVTAAHTPTTYGTVVLELGRGRKVWISAGLRIRRLGQAPSATPGVDMVTVTAIGYEPSSTIFADLYGIKDDPDRLEWLADLPPATADRFGRGVLHWPVPRGIQTGRYAILVEPVAETSTTCDVQQCTIFKVSN